MDRIEKNFFSEIGEAIAGNPSACEVSSGVWKEFCDPAPVRRELAVVEPGGEAAGGQAADPVAGPAAVPAVASWRELEAEAMSCKRCRLRGGCRNVVFGEGSREAELMFIGEGPGAEEDAQGRPFVGPAGQLLDKMIAAMHFSRESVYIANIVKCRPPGNRAPEPDEAAACAGYLDRQIDLVRPRVIVLLGATPLKYLIGVSGIKRNRGQWTQYRGIPTMPTFHPAYLLRTSADKRLTWNDLKMVMALLGIAP